MHALTISLSFVFHSLRLLALGALCAGLSACGSGGSAGNDVPGKQAAGLYFVAGSIGGTGFIDAKGAAARFHMPQDVASDASGNLYVADTGNYVIRKITPDGTVSTFAGTPGEAGTTDGDSSHARLSWPTRIVADTAGNAYVLDQGNENPFLPSIRKVTTSGSIATLATGAELNAALRAAGVRYVTVTGIAVDKAGTVFVSAPTSVLRIDASHSITTIPMVSLDGQAPSDGPFFPGYAVGIAIDGDGNLYLAQGGACRIIKVSPVGVATTWYAGPDGDPQCGNLDAVALNIDNTGNLYTIRRIWNPNANPGFDDSFGYGGEVRKISPDGKVTTLASPGGIYGYEDGPAASARFSNPRGMTRDGAGNLYVADTADNVIRKIDPAGMVSTIAGTAQGRGNADGTGTNARFSTGSIAADAAGNIYFTDPANATVRRIDTVGTVSTIAGKPGERNYVDGPGPSARFVHPAGLALDKSGNVFLTDITQNYGDIDFRQSAIRKLSPTSSVTTLAGGPAPGSDDGTGATAKFMNPLGLTLDSKGNAYVADTYNFAIRKITPSGAVTTIAGAAADNRIVDGPRNIARFNAPVAIASDSADNLYVIDQVATPEPSAVIRKITPDGVVTTIAGSKDGTGPRVLAVPTAQAIDEQGNLYVTDTMACVVRKFTPPAYKANIIAGIEGRCGTALGGLPSQISNPTGIAYLGNGVLAISTGGSVLKLVLPR